MFDFEKYLTLDLMEKTVSEFAWPLPFRLEDDLPDGIILSFPASQFEFCEGPDGILVRFLPANTRGYPGLHLGHALSVIVPVSNRGITPVTPGLTDTVALPTSEEKTKQEVRNACKIILTHLTRVIAGDFSWVDVYLKPSDR